MKMLLSFDGGGVLGIGPAAMLSLMYRQPWMPPVDSYSGTSIGSAIAAACAIGMPWPKVEKLLEFILPIVFDDPPLAWKLDPRKPRYKANALETFLQDTFGSLRMCDAKFHLFIVAFDYKTGKPKVWDPTDGDLISECVLASCSAPTYFPPVHGLVDGGLVANNPAMCHITGCIRKLGWKLNDLWMLSFGTNGDYWKDPEVDSNTSKLEWAKLLLENTTRGNEEIATFQAQTLLAERFLRIEPIISTNYGLDDVSCMKDYAQIWRSKFAMCDDEMISWFRSFTKRTYL